jgi:hypothetical protein
MGASVIRKVRNLGNNSTSNNPNNKRGESSGSDAKLELEAQLEMEPSADSESDDDSEPRRHGKRDKSKPALAVTNNNTNTNQGFTQQSTSDAASEAAVEPLTPQKQQEIEAERMFLTPSVSECGFAGETIRPSASPSSTTAELALAIHTFPVEDDDDNNDDDNNDAAKHDESKEGKESEVIDQLQVNNSHTATAMIQQQPSSPTSAFPSPPGGRV